MGLAAVDLAKVLGCKVIAASASDEKLAVIARDYAPDATVNATHRPDILSSIFSPFMF